MPGPQDHAEVILAIDLGGTFIKSGLVHGGSVRPLPPVPSHASGGVEEIAAALGEVLAAAGDFAAVAVAAPGPFDYVKGISFMRHKFPALYGQDLRAFFPRHEVRFVHDAGAFALGEFHGGALRGCANCGAVTLGTGLGAAVLKDGTLLALPNGMPQLEVSLWDRPMRGETVEHWVSAAALTRGFPGTTAKELGMMAKAGNAAAQEAFRQFGEALAEALAPWCACHRLARVAIGGQIARDLDLFSTPLRDLPVVAAQCPDHAALLGAASLFRPSKS